ncbi:branched-chain amino acid ABC transporter permease [Ilumatobacter nonamiensis]|uniref:branched-chain amino acid ABC transporter permease n=1 Tax=Ilumatobacter nonamiensis TaxID=467093 RepID=UPI000348061F|nr:branched-chain amino acid ABC transporter permease [Ilumatobacter nonamiensis]
MQQTINGLASGSIYALLGLGVTLIWGVLHVLTFTHAQVLTWGAFGSLIAINRGYPVPVAILVGMAVAAGLSVLIDSTVLEMLRRRGASEYAFVVATIGLAFMLESILRNRTRARVEPYSRDGFPRGPIELLGQNVPKLQLAVLATSLIAMAGLAIWLNHTRAGRGMKAVAYSPETATLLGINPRFIYAVAYTVSGMLAALAGVFVAVSTASVSYSSGDRLLLTAFAVIILGGMGSVPGAVVGGLILGVIEVYATVHVSSKFSEVVAYLVILVVLLVRPSGLFGAKEATRV